MTRPHTWSSALALLAAASCGGGGDAVPSVDLEANGPVDAGDGSSSRPGAVDDAGRDGAAPPSCGLRDATAHAPPEGGATPLSPPGAWLPGAPGFVGRGEVYVDPVFGCTVRRLTDVFPHWGSSLVYAKNGLWNADATRYAANVAVDGEVDIVDAATGALVRASVPFDAESSFDPIDVDVFYTWSTGSASLVAYHVGAGASAVVKTFPAALGSLGGSVDFIDRTGRYFLLAWDGALHVWDKPTDTVYAGSVPATFGAGWAGISPDGAYVIAAGDASAEPNHHWSYVIDHATKTLTTAGTMFWSLCGDHGDIASASDGKTYLVTHDCNDEPAVYRVDVSLAQSAADVAKQKSDNVRLFVQDWKDSGHFSCVARGPRQDWCYVSVTSDDDTFAGAGPWRPFEQEVVMVEVVAPFEVRRLAHHRSRSPDSIYERMPRVNTSWDGAKAAFASDYGYDAGAVGYSDIYVLSP